MARIKVDTDDLYDLALRYERLLFSLKDVTDALGQARMNLESGMSGGEGMLKLYNLIRGVDGVEYDLRNSGTMLKFAAVSYEDCHQRITQLAKELSKTLHVEENI